MSNTGNFAHVFEKDVLMHFGSRNIVPATVGCGGSGSSREIRCVTHRLNSVKPSPMSRFLKRIRRITLADAAS